MTSYILFNSRCTTKQSTTTINNLLLSTFINRRRCGRPSAFTKYGGSDRPFKCSGLYFTLNSNPPFFLCLNTSFVFTNYQPIQRNASYNRTVRIMHRYCIMQHGYHSQILYINILVDWSLSGIMTSKLVIRESESSRPAASSILISRMTSSSVIIPYIMLCKYYNIMSIYD